MTTTLTEYHEFLASKLVTAPASGFEVADADINQKLFDWQRVVVRWALRRGKAALFEDCGLGKGPQTLEWARQVSLQTEAPVLILCPLAVAKQMEREGGKFAIPVTICRKQSDVKNGVNVANYEMMEHFRPDEFGGVALDEASILKNYSGVTKQELERQWEGARFKLVGTATPSPNSPMEIGNYAQFLDVMPSNEMLARWFIADSMKAGNYRLKEHGKQDFYRWLATWAVCISKPSDIGFSDEGYILPPLDFHIHIVDVDTTIDTQGQLFRTPELSATSFHKEKRRTLNDRVEAAAKLISETPGPWIVWTDTDYEADAVMQALPTAKDVRGSMPLPKKEELLVGFAQGEFDHLETKARIAGLGLNYQHCWQQAHLGINYSFEELYQKVRRSYRFGQTRSVQVHLFVSETELPVLESVQAKQEQHEEMRRGMVAAMSEVQLDGIGTRKVLADVETDVAYGKEWELHLGDSCQLIRDIPDEEVKLSIYSPPFSNLYIYSDSVADMGNSVDWDEFFEHYRYLIQEMYRVTAPGRLSVVHCKDMPRFKGRDGAAGLRDFPGEIIRLHEECGWTYHSRVTIWKDPKMEMLRTHNSGLLYTKSLLEDSTKCRQGMADYLVIFRKWGDEERWVPVPHDKDEFSVQKWREWASPVWMDIQQTNVLNTKLARDNADEKHICPLQLDVIERALVLWSNPGDLVYSPFTGIGSEGVMSLRLGRKFLGGELKRSYFEMSCEHLALEEHKKTQCSFADLLEA